MSSIGLLKSVAISPSKKLHVTKSAATVATTLVGVAGAANAAPPSVATYTFQSTLNSNVAGAPALVAIDPLGTSSLRHRHGFREPSDCATVVTHVMDLPADGMVNFFLDNVVGGGQEEWSLADISLIRLYNAALTDVPPPPPPPIRRSRNPRPSR